MTPIHIRSVYKACLMIQRGLPPHFFMHKLGGHCERNGAVMVSPSSFHRFQRGRFAIRVTKKEFVINHRTCVERKEEERWFFCGWGLCWCDGGVASPPWTVKVVSKALRRILKTASCQALWATWAHLFAHNGFRRNPSCSRAHLEKCAFYLVSSRGLCTCFIFCFVFLRALQYYNLSLFLFLFESCG